MFSFPWPYHSIMLLSVDNEVQKDGEWWQWKIMKKIYNGGWLTIKLCYILNESENIKLVLPQVDIYPNVLVL